MMSKKFRLQGRWIKGKALLALTFLLIVSCGPSDEEVASPNGDPKGAFYSLAVLNRFDHGINREMARGKELYSQYCVICHGQSGDGKGFNAYNLKSNFGVQPFDFTDAAAVDQTTFDEIKKAITHGGPAVDKSQYMPPWGNVMSEYDLASLTDYVWHSLMNKKSKE
jgi:hypothetical protein